MRVYLMRQAAPEDDHATMPSAQEHPEIPPLELLKARAVAQGLARLGWFGGHLLFSPRPLAAQTAEILAQVLNVPAGRLRRSEALQPEGRLEHLLDELSRLETNQVLCVGHSPHLDGVVAHLLGWAAPRTALKKAGVACLEWEPRAPGEARLVWLCPPKILRRLGR
ncbi:MAG TPA: hypothetical protein VNN17_06595 [Terriglobia bacterium]|nr:hypothetical protein [Terriglobia bacterium]